jgi:hypothetical protein
MRNGVVIGSLPSADSTTGFSGGVAAHYALPAGSSWDGAPVDCVSLGYRGWWIDAAGEPLGVSEYPNGIPAWRPAPSYRLEVFLDASVLPDELLVSVEGWSPVGSRRQRIIDLGGIVS